MGCEVDKGRADSTPPQYRLDEQAIELGRIANDQNNRKASDPIVSLGDEYFAALDLITRQVNRVRVRLQLLIIFAERQRGAQLKRLQCHPLVGPGEPNGEQAQRVRT